MWMMAMRVSEAGDEWTKLRKEALRVVEGVEGLAMGDVSVPSPPPAPAVYEEDEEDEEEDVEGEKKNAATLDPPPLKKRKLGLGKPVGIYEPHANIIHCRSSPCPSFLLLNQSCFVDRADTQPTRSCWQQLPDSAAKREVLGGTKAGNGAWALAWVDTVMELPKPDDPPSPAALAREEALKAVELESVEEELVMVE
jgi:chromatin structure-remodeling complex protein RSC7